MKRKFIPVEEAFGGRQKAPQFSCHRATLSRPGPPRRVPHGGFCLVPTGCMPRYAPKSETEAACSTD